MTTAATLDDLRIRILAGEVLLFLETYEEQRWEEELAALAGEVERGLVVWSVTAGPQPPLDSQAERVADPKAMLDQLAGYPREHLFLLKDFHPFFDDPCVIRKIRDLLGRLAAERKSLLFVGPVANVPLELRKDAVVVELPLPGPDELRSALHDVLQSLSPAEQSLPIERRHTALGSPLSALSSSQEDRLVRAVLGLTLSEARRAFARALHRCESIDDGVFAQLVAEKRHMVAGSDLLEFFDLDDGVSDIGGLDGLKEWIAQRAEAFSADAQDRGVSHPKGMLLLGVQGCGKSLTARATARLLGFPLVRMEVANLLESARGRSEQNLRDALRVVETIAPAVLWLEEIDKAFAGFEEEAATDATMSRMTGRFLTWLQEHTAPVFVVATANNVSQLPPELLRRGRFDEIFFVDLPNYSERRQILGIHLQKRGWKPDKFDLDRLSNDTEGYSGAELEQIVNSAIIESHAGGRVVSQEDLDRERELLVPLSVTMEDEIFALREWARVRCRAATPEYRVLDVIDAEVRRGEHLHVADGVHDERISKWIELAEHGQIRAAIIEHVRQFDRVTFSRLQADFAPFVPTAGEFGLVLRSDPRILVWPRLSSQLVDLLIDLTAAKRLYINPTAIDAYDPPVRPKLAVLESLPEEKQPSPAWLPLQLRLIPPLEGTPRYHRLARVRMGKA
ncbi:MAG: AAA family ATPase [Planctomycetaceae bacterium]|nr:AAA family ATPase [Planctomycetaceae bacterium]